MFTTLGQKLILGVYVFILLSIPVGSYLATQITNTKSQANETKNTKPAVKLVPKSTTSPAKELLNASKKQATSAGLLIASPTPAPLPSETTIATSYGPTLSLKAILEGRPAGNQSTKLFVGIAEGNLTSNPKFLLSFSVNLPASGEYTNLSLAGLTPGSRYSALLKVSAQLAVSSSFTMSPTTTKLNDGQALTMLSGDLNDDNVINSADYSIVQKLLGITSQSITWNENADLNKDGVINSFDLSLIAKNIGAVGASGAWTSPIPKNATPSASLNSPAVGSPDSDEGYWLWIPK